MADLLPAGLLETFSALNPWQVKFTASADQARKNLNLSEKLVLDRLLKELERFPPSKHQFKMGMGLSTSSLEVTVTTEGFVKLSLTARYRLIPEECAITRLEIHGAMKEGGIS